jgi:hypothetical protein
MRRCEMESRDSSGCSQGPDLRSNVHAGCNARISDLESQLKAAREENARVQSEFDDALFACGEAPRTDLPPAPPLSDARIERAARVMYQCCTDSGSTWERRTECVHKLWMQCARDVLAAADAVPPAKTGEEEGR